MRTHILAGSALLAVVLFGGAAAADVTPPTDDCTTLGQACNNAPPNFFSAGVCVDVGGSPKCRASDAGTAGSAGTAGTAGTAGKSGTGGAASGGSSDDGGCSIGSPARTGLFSLLLAAGAVALLRRRSR
ncbi:MAG: hypothetical protein R3B13_33335 [Polyangiaceae bacterium]